MEMRVRMGTLLELSLRWVLQLWAAVVGNTARGRGLLAVFRIHEKVAPSTMMLSPSRQSLKLYLAWGWSWSWGVGLLKNAVEVLVEDRKTSTAAYSSQRPAS